MVCVNVGTPNSWQSTRMSLLRQSFGAILPTL